MSDVKERVRIWNTFFKLAWSEAKSLHETRTGKKSEKEFHPAGGTLPKQEFHKLATFALCCLAIEARANHLIEELVEDGKIDPDVGKSVQRLPTKRKWFLLPRLAGRRKRLDPKKQPHQSIVEICTRRNSLLHVDYAKLQKKLPGSQKTLKLFDEFIKGMEDMNVVLGRIKKPRQKVLKISQFNDC